MLDQECQGRHRSLVPRITWRDERLVRQGDHATFDRGDINIILIRFGRRQGIRIRIRGHVCDILSVKAVVMEPTYSRQLPDRPVRRYLEIVGLEPSSVVINSNLLKGVEDLAGVQEL